MNPDIGTLCERITRWRTTIASPSFNKGWVTMRKQCQMPGDVAVVIQAALILEGRRPLLTQSQTKLAKANGAETGFVNRGLTLSSAREAAPYLGPKYNACPGATAACINACVGSRMGQGTLPSSKIARIGRSIVLALYRKEFFALIRKEITKAERFATKRGWRLAFRTNIASDHWQLADELAQLFPNVVFYDYTAVMGALRNGIKRLDFALGTMPPLVRRVYSRKDGRTKQALSMLKEGHGIAVVFAISARSKGAFPATWHGAPVIDGDVNDLWFTRAPSTGPFVVGLRVKGTNEQAAAAIGAGFAIQPHSAASERRHVGQVTS